jgi:threonyl-tRNA synthetase
LQCLISKLFVSFARTFKQVQKQINEVGYYVDIDESDRSLRKKVADARDAPYNYILVVGQKEVATGQVTVRLREDPEGRKDLPEMSIESLLDEFKFKTVNFL